MIFLILSILASSFIFIIFRLFPYYKIDTFQAIVINYFMACFFGFFLYGNELKSEALTNLAWLPTCIICGILFILLFLIMGVSAQKNGVAQTSVAIKMSMAMTMLLMVVWYKEAVTFVKIIGFILSIIGVVLMSWSSNESKKHKPIYWMLLALFIGGGLLDFSLNYTQNNLLEHLPASLFSAFGFAVAGIIGVLILIYRYFTQNKKFEVRTIIAGIILGIPNFFSIYLLMRSYSEMAPWSNSTVLAITNVSIVILSAFYGFVLFKEKFSLLKGFGLVSSILAIVFLYYSNLG